MPSIVVLHCKYSNNGLKYAIFHLLPSHALNTLVTALVQSRLWPRHTSRLTTVETDDVFRWVCVETDKICLLRRKIRLLEGVIMSEHVSLMRQNRMTGRRSGGKTGKRVSFTDKIGW